MGQKTDILFPTGRLVGGSLYKARTEDAEGRPLVYKTGADMGKPRLDYWVALAIPKEPGHTHFSQTEWGAKIWMTGHQFLANANAIPTFAWKITDGDSTTANKKGKRPCDQVGYAGHWVVSLSSSFPSKVYNKDGTQAIVEPDAVKTGYYVQIFGDVSGNDSTSQPGVFINHKMVALQAYGQEISFGPDAKAVGFGGGALPAGASATPPAGAFNPAAAPAPAPLAPPPVIPGAPAMPAPPIAPPPATVAPSAPVAGVVSAPNMPAPPPTVVTPNMGILNPAPAAAPAPPAPPAAPVPPVAAAGPAMSAKAAGVTYQQFKDSGWTDDAMRSNGYFA